MSSYTVAGSADIENTGIVWAKQIVWSFWS